jgi:hypothetical protein
MNQQDQAQFIEDMNEKHVTLETTVGVKQLEAALDVDYATIKRLND